jgi:N-methylhydantoinase B
VPSQAVRRGDRLAVVTGGGGGYGDPLSRPAEAVARDVRDGYLTPERALEEYRVAVSADGRLDEPVTAALRGRA